MPKKPKQRIEASNKVEKEKTETKIVPEIKEDVKSDAFSEKEKKDIIAIVRADVEYGITVQKEYVAQKVIDLQHFHGAKPSTLENLTKKDWMSDRNLGLSRAIADSFQATILATAWTPESINFIATNTFELDNRSNQEKFTKWGMGKQEADALPEMDDFIHNKIIVGNSFFKIYRKTWEEWVDKRIPVKNKKGDTYKYEIKTEKVKMSKGMIENIPDIDDILMPAYGKNIQALPFFIHVLHLDGESVLDYIKRKVFVPSDKETYKNKLYNHCYKKKIGSLKDEKQDNLGITENSITDDDVRRLPIDVYEWYGYFEKGGRNERFRCIIDLENEEFLSGKPVRKINRSGKIPFAGGPLMGEPGCLHGPSLMEIIAPIVNAFNNVYNQKADFQSVTNIPFGFHIAEEGSTQQTYELEPMISYPVPEGGKIQDKVFFPNIQRSMAWAESDIRILFEVLERLTGAASYFAVGQQRNKTLGQDMLVDRQSETRFGLWVSRVMDDIKEAIGMWFELYQDFPPKGLAERVVGEDGKKIFPNLSIDSLRGDTAVQMTPDKVAGSKAFTRQLRLWAFQVGQSMIWLNPQINPKGNWNLCADTYREILGFSDSDVKRYLGEEPKAKFDETELGNEWYRFMNGEDFDPPEGETALALQHLKGHDKQKEEKYQDLTEECRPNFDAHYFKTLVNAMKFTQNVQREQAANNMAANMVSNNPNQPGQQQPGQPGQPQPQPGQVPVEGTPNVA